MLLHSFTSWLAFGSLAFGATLPRADPPTRVLVDRQATSASPVPDGPCTNSPRTRNCWSQGYSISTDFDAKAPPDGTTVTYNFEISNTTRPNPDGSGGNRPVMLVNGVYPGPTLRAKWGDEIVVNVKNNLRHNGTGIHWHGLLQHNSCQHDGVPGVTECPIAPNATRQYKFRATQFGTSWYHSHWSAQYGDGVLGPIIIDGPASSGYDEDLGALPITDWYYDTAFTLNEVAQHSTRGPPPADNILVNGTHVNANGGGSYAKMNVVQGKKYRIRIINTSVDGYFSVSMDGHPFTVITSDFVPIRPWVTDQLTLAIGQRYDVIISTNQTVGNYWFRVSPGNCGTNRIVGTGIPLGAVLHYDGASNANPTSSGVTMRTTCDDELTRNLIPYAPNEVPRSIVGGATRLNVDHFQNASNHNLFRWLVDGTPHIVNWNDPTLETILAGSQDFGPNANVKSTQEKDAWNLWWVQTTSSFALAHPLHLHGHDFYILKSGLGVWDGSTTDLNFDNPTRRDTANLPPGGYLLLAWPNDNPGLWIMHCHIAWHASQGLSMQFGERYSDIQAGSLEDVSVLKKGCDEWDKYWYPGNPEKPYDQTDSGI